MYRLLRAFGIFTLAALLAIFVVACGGDEGGGGETVTPANLTGSTPPNGGEIAANGTLTLTFDNPPENVTVNGQPAQVAGKTATFNGPFTPGAATLNIAWDNGPGGNPGSATINLTVKAPDTTPPKVTKSTVKDGDKDVDPEPLNTDGITIEFDENVTGTLAVTDEAGNPLWTCDIKDNKATCLPIKGKELGNEQTFKVDGSVKDGAGNETKISWTVVTKGKE